MLAAAAVYVAQLSVGASDPFSHTLSRHSGYSLAAISDCAQHLAALWRKAPNASLVAVYKKVGEKLVLGCRGRALLVLCGCTTA